MARVIRSTTSKFDVSKERPNPINPIPGESLLLWLRSQVRPEMDMSEPDAEDWGWYSTIEWEGRLYLLGSSASEEAGIEREWILQIDKHRSVKEKLFGSEKMTRDDACALYFQRVLEGEPSFNAVSVDPEL